MKKNMETLIRRQDFICTDGGRDWRDGLLLGNGNLAAVASAPGHLEWVVNKVDVFDPTSTKELLKKIIPYDHFLEKIKDMPRKNTLFLRELENAPFKGKRQKDTMSACILRLSSWYGIGWSAPPMPRAARRLSLYDAVLEEQLDSHNMHLIVRAFIPREREVICMRLSGKQGNRIPQILEMVRPADVRLNRPVWHTETNGILGFVQKVPGGKSCYAVAAMFVPHKKSDAAIPADFEDLSGKIVYQGDCDLFVTVKTGKKMEETWTKALSELSDARTVTFEELERLHKAWWHEHWEKTAFADFGKEKDIQKAYTFSLYELACAFGKAPVPGLNGMSYGPLNERIPGVGVQGYTHDQNAQLSALALIPSNNPELFCAYADTYLAMLPRLKKNTRKMFHCDGVFLPVVTNQNGLEYPTLSYRCTFCGSAYTGMVLAYAWRYFRDVELLRNKIYPLLREFVIFYTHLMEKGSDGRYHLNWSVPPEIYTLTRDELSSISLLKVCLETTIEAAKILKKDRKYLADWEDLLAHYPAFPRRKDGAYWGGPDIPENHFFYGGHTLYPFFPAGCENDPDTVQKTMDFIGKTAIERTYADYNGEFHMFHDWSEFILTASTLRMGKRKDGWDRFRRFLKLFGKENGLFSHDSIIIGDERESEANEWKYAPGMFEDTVTPTGEKIRPFGPYFYKGVCVTRNPDAKRLAPPVLEGNSNFVFLATETLLQSHAGELKLFPCVPEDFTGSFVNFPAQGGFLVDASMVKGKLRHVRIRSPHGGTCRLHGKEITLKAGDTFKQEADFFLNDALNVWLHSTKRPIPEENTPPLSFPERGESVR